MCKLNAILRTVGLLEIKQVVKTQLLPFDPPTENKINLWHCHESRICTEVNILNAIFSSYHKNRNIIETNCFPIPFLKFFRTNLLSGFYDAPRSCILSRRAQTFHFQVISDLLPDSISEFHVFVFNMRWVVKWLMNSHSTYQILFVHTEWTLRTFFPVWVQSFLGWSSRLEHCLLWLGETAPQTCATVAVLYCAVPRCLQYAAQHWAVSLHDTQLGQWVRGARGCRAAHYFSLVHTMRHCNMSCCLIIVCLLLVLGFCFV